MIDRKNIMDIAKRECKGDASTEEIEWLQKPENRLAWCQSLLTALSDYESSAMYHRERVNMMAQDVKLGVVSHKDYLEEKDKFDTWYFLPKTRQFRTLTKSLVLPTQSSSIKENPKRLKQFQKFMT